MQYTEEDQLEKNGYKDQWTILPQKDEIQED